MELNQKPDDDNRRWCCWIKRAYRTKAQNSCKRKYINPYNIKSGGGGTKIKQNTVHKYTYPLQKLSSAEMQWTIPKSEIPALAPFSKIKTYTIKVWGRKTKTDAPILDVYRARHDEKVLAASTCQLTCPRSTTSALATGWMETGWLKGRKTGNPKERSATK
jgi:hypothetical protein